MTWFGKKQELLPKDILPSLEKADDVQDRIEYMRKKLDEQPTHRGMDFSPGAIMSLGASTASVMTFFNSFRERMPDE